MAHEHGLGLVAGMMTEQKVNRACLGASPGQRLVAGGPGSLGQRSAGLQPVQAQQSSRNAVPLQNGAGFVGLGGGLRT